jgi:hypothetical protein
MNGKQISISSSIKCLGIVLSSDLKWTDHINYLKPKLYSVIASLYRLGQIHLPLNELIGIYKALFEPLLTYCIVIWGSTFSNAIGPLSVIQNDAIRTILGANRSSHLELNQTYDRLGIRNIQSLYRSKILTLMFKNLHNLICVAATFDFRLNKKPRTKGQMPIIREKHNLTLREKSIRLEMINLWNGLYQPTRDLKSLEEFKICV